MATPYALRCLAILPKVHVKMFLHCLLSLRRVGESETTLLTLHGHTFVKEMYYVWAMPAHNHELYCRRKCKDTLPADFRTREFYILG